MIFAAAGLGRAIAERISIGAGNRRFRRPTCWRSFGLTLIAAEKRSGRVTKANVPFSFGGDARGGHHAARPRRMAHQGDSISIEPAGGPTTLIPSVDAAHQPKK